MVLTLDRYRLKCNIETFDRISLAISGAFNVLNLHRPTEGEPVPFVRIIEKNREAIIYYTLCKGYSILWTVLQRHHALVSLPRSAFPFGHILLKRGSRIDFCHGELMFYFPLVVFRREKKSSSSCFVQRKWPINNVYIPITLYE